jgi:hypothetical protein
MNLTKRVNYFATKFDSPQTEALYDLGAEWMLDVDGNSDAPMGWWQAITIDSDELRRYVVVMGHEDALRVLVESRAPFDSIVGHWLLRGDSNGFVWTAEYDTAYSRDVAAQSLADEFCAWDDQEDYS